MPYVCINYYDVKSFTTKENIRGVIHSKASDATTLSIPVGATFLISASSSLHPQYFIK